MPRAAALYITDRVDLDDMTGSFGLRYDTFDPNAVLLDSTVSVKHMLSPRIGLSYQLTESDILSMNYGRYYQLPSFLHLYGGNDLSLSRSFGPQGNPDLKPMETISYELGIRHYFSNFASIGVTGYYRDFSGLIDTRRIWGTLGVYRDVFINTDFGTTPLRKQGEPPPPMCRTAPTSRQDGSFPPANPGWTGTSVTR